MNIIKYIKANIGFTISLVFFAILVISPDAKALLMQGLIKTGLFTPNISHLQSEQPSEAAETSGPMAPLASFISLDGKNLDLASLKGKVVFINFWATWCPPCIAEMPSVNSLFNKMKSNDKVVFLMVDADNKLENSEAFMKKSKYDLPVYGPAGALPNELFKGSLPTTVIINKKGEIVFLHEGMADYNTGETEKLLNQLSK